MVRGADKLSAQKSTVDKLFKENDELVDEEGKHEPIVDELIREARKYIQMLEEIEKRPATTGRLEKHI